MGETLPYHKQLIAGVIRIIYVNGFLVPMFFTCFPMLFANMELNELTLILCRPVKRSTYIWGKIISSFLAQLIPIIIFIGSMIFWNLFCHQSHIIWDSAYKWPNFEDFNNLSAGYIGNIGAWIMMIICPFIWSMIGILIGVTFVFIMKKHWMNMVGILLIIIPASTKMLCETLITYNDMEKIHINLLTSTWLFTVIIPLALWILPISIITTCCCKKAKWKSVRV